MKQVYRLLSIALLLALTACGAIIKLDGLSIEVPQRATNQPLPATATALPSTATQTASPTVTASPSPTASPTVISVPTVTTLVNLNIRSGASIYSSTLTKPIPANTTIQLFGKSADSAWLGVRYVDSAGNVWNGWVSSADNLVRINGATLGSLPIVSVIPPITITPTIDPTPTQERPKQRIGYNANGQGIADTNYYLQVVTNPCATIQIVMNNLSLAVRIKELCPDTIVVSRNYSALEGSEWFYRSAANFVDEWKREGHPEIVRYSTNEPSYGGMQSLSTFVARDIELMALAYQAGFKVAMGNFSVGNYQLSDIQNGLYDGYLRAINQYGHYLALHEYSVALLPFGVGLWPTTFLLDRAYVQPDRWPTAAQLPTAFVNGTCTNNPVYPSYWFLRRGDWFLLRADCIGILRPRILLTEFSWDNLSNIKPQIEPLRSRYGLPQYFNDMRGINTYPKLWQYYFPFWTFEQAACEQLLWSEEIYPDDYLGMAMFSWTTSPDWQQTNFASLRVLHQCLAAA